MAGWTMTIHYRLAISKIERHWCSGNIGASQALAPGSIPGWRTILVCVYPDDRVQHVVERAYLLGLLAQIKCSICS